MKPHFLIAALLSLSLGGCAVFQRSPTWERVVGSRSQFAGADAGAKDGYIEHLHQVLSSAGVEHRVVTFQFHYRNVYHEESVQTRTAVVYRDDTTPRHPWWIMDEFHHVPVWLPTAALEAQLAFFVQRDVEVISVKEYGAAPAAQPRISSRGKTLHRQIAATPKTPQRRLFAVTETRPRRAKPAAPAKVTPRAATRDASTLFRTTHGTKYDPASSVDRQKMDGLRRQLFARNQTARLRTE